MSIQHLPGIIWLQPKRTQNTNNSTKPHIGQVLQQVRVESWIILVEFNEKEILYKSVGKVIGKSQR